MKDFLKMVLAVICGLVITSVILCIISVGILGAIVAVGSAAPSTPKEGALYMDMSSVTIGEQSTEANPLGGISGQGSTATIGIWDAVQAINAAAQDSGVKYIYLRSDNSSTTVAELQEVRKALQNFRSTSGKPVISYIESPTTGSYYLASVSDKVYMTDQIGATTQVTGISTQMYFLGDLLNKLGVNVQLIRHGKYKSAGETYTRGSSSPENREQYQRLVDSMWEGISSEIAESRGISVDSLNNSIDELKLNLPQDFVDCGLVDELVSREQLEDKLTVLAMKDKFEDVKFINFADYVSSKVTPSKAKNKIAVIYADGEIVEGAGTKNIAGRRFAEIIHKVCADSTVKAVVLRVNSPGGSVLASEKIKRELDALKAVKPVIASYGNYAASGGYWISNNCDKIYSDAATLTGSIGVFGMVPDLSKTAKDVAHIGIESISSNKHGDMYGLMRPFDQAEYDYMLRSIETVYDKFTTTVSEGRSIPKETVDSIGQGRVWTGSDALTIHLVDEIGTLEDAIHYAATVAGDPDLGKWNVKGYPRVPSGMEQVMEMFGQEPEGSDEDVLVSAYKDLSTPKVVARMDTRITVK